MSTAVAKVCSDCGVNLVLEDGIAWELGEVPHTTARCRDQLKAQVQRQDDVASSKPSRHTPRRRS